GQKTQEKILSGIANREAYAARHRWADAFAVSQPILHGLRALPQVERAEAAGSLRRKKETVGDLDFLVAATEPAPIMDWFTAQDGIAEVTARGETKSSIRLDGGLQADLRVVPPAQFFYALHHFTGSKEHNVRMRQRALERGLSLSEWGLFPEDTRSGKEYAPKPSEREPEPVEGEADLFQKLELAYIPPELREDRGEIEAAEKDALPQLIEPGDIRGVFHNHTTQSDGRATLEEMVQGAQDLGFEYLGIADHSKASFQANGLDEDRLEKQCEAIRALNESGKFKTYVFTGTEVDILSDGRMDFSDEVLAGLDYCVASIHAGLTGDEAAMTQRLVKALENPHVTMLGHLTGRLLLKREAYPVNVAKVIDAAIANGKIIELNANPWRLDMDWRHWHQAAERGLLTSINPDAHDPAQLEFYINGVYAARKGWLEPKHVLNTRSLAEVKAYLDVA
ncbi:MAG: PHP domain-containing protein, partial [Verrucomicrobiota bacterium]